MTVHADNELPGIALMNIAAMDNDTLPLLRDFFAKVADHGTEGGKERAKLYLPAIDAELARRHHEPACPSGNADLAPHRACPGCGRQQYLALSGWWTHCLADADAGCPPAWRA